MRPRGEVFGRPRRPQADDRIYAPPVTASDPGVSPADPCWIESSRGAAHDFHHRVLPAPLRPTAWIHQVTRPTFVLGSSQPADDLRSSAAMDAGWDVCRRRSGGGLVIVTPDNGVWIDLVLPSTSMLWVDDVDTSAHWVADVWARTLRQIIEGSGTRVEAHHGPMIGRDAGRRLCFAGRASGEVMVSDHKVVGLSQRRTRDAARFQTLCLLHWDPEPVMSFGGPSLQRLAATDLAIGWPVGVTAPTVDEVTEVFLDQLCVDRRTAEAPSVD